MAAEGDDTQNKSTAVVADATSGKSVTNNNNEEQHDDHRGSKSNAWHLFHAVGPAYGLSSQYWKALLLSAVPQGLIMACIALAFFNCYLALAKATWLNDDYHHALEYIPPRFSGEVAEWIRETYPYLNLTLSVSSEGEEQVEHAVEHHASADEILRPLQLGEGPWWYVALLAGGGFGVGLIKVLWSLLFRNHRYPKVLPSFLTEVRELEGHDFLLSIPVLACSALSLGMGASVGPEAALGFVGTGLGSIIFGRRWRIGNIRARSAAPANAIENDDNDDGNFRDDHWLSYVLPDFSQEPELCAMDGMTAAFGALFPSQFLSGLLVHELGMDSWYKRGHRFSFMETVTRTAISSSCAYVLFTGLEDRTLLESIPVPFAAYQLLPEIRSIDMLTGLILGFLSGCVGLLGFVLMGVFGKLGGACFATVDALGQKMGLPEDVLGTLLNPAIGGTLLGLLCKAVPLLIGDGADQLGPIITLADELGMGNLVATGFLKLVMVAISLGFGFVGGPIFPLIFTGTIMGIVVHKIVPAVPEVISIACCMVAVPSAFIPAIFTMTTLGTVVLALGGAATSPVFLACAISYTTVCGMGVVQDMLRPAVHPPKEGPVPETETAENAAPETAESAVPEAETEGNPVPVQDAGSKPKQSVRLSQLSHLSV